jgi:hypothetical protein
MAKPKHTSTTQAPAQPTGGTQPTAPAAPTAAPVNAALAVAYKAGKPYNVRQGTAQANDRSWQAIQAVLQAAGGAATRAEIVAAVTPYNHVPFVGYCIRRGWLTPVAQAASTQAA